MTRPRRSRDGLRHLALKSRDLRATERFYSQILGLRRAFDHPGMLFLTTPGTDDLLNFVGTRAAFDPRRGGLDHFGIHIPRQRWRAVQAALEAAGVRIRSRRGRSAVYIEDPNGYTLELYVD